MVEFREEELRFSGDPFCADCGRDFEDSPQTIKSRKHGKILGIRYKANLCDACMGYRPEKKDAESKCACGCLIGKCGCDEGCKCGCNHKKGGAAWLKQNPLRL